MERSDEKLNTWATQSTHVQYPGLLHGCNIGRSMDGTHCSETGDPEDPRTT